MRQIPEHSDDRRGIHVGRSGVGRCRTRSPAPSLRALPTLVASLALLLLAAAWPAAAQPTGQPTAPQPTPTPTPAQPAGNGAQPAAQPAPAAPAPVTLEQIAELRERLEADTTITDPNVRAQATEALAAAAASVAEHAQNLAAIAQRQQEIDGAPAALEVHRTNLAAPSISPASQVPPDLPLPELEQRLSQARAQLEASRGTLTATEQEPAQRQARREAIPGALATAQQQFEAADDAATAPPGEGTPPLVAEARQLASRAAAQAARSRIQALQRELASLDARRENLQARIDLARRAVAEGEALVTYLDQRVAEARRIATQEAAEAARRAREAAFDQHPRLREVLEDTGRMAARRAVDPETGSPGTERLAQTATARVQRARADLRTLSADYLSTMERVRAIGLTDAMGQLLREKRRRLDSPLQLQEQFDADRESRAAALLELFEVRPLEGTWGQPAENARAIAEAQEDLTPEEREVLRAKLQPAMQQRLEVVRSLLAELETYQTALGQLDELNRTRLRVLRSFINDIDRTILWVPSARPARTSDLAEIVEGVRWLVAPEAWDRAVRGRGGLMDDISERPVTTIGPLLLVLIFALFGRPPLARATNRIHERARRVATDSFALTVKALLLACVIAAVPAAMLIAIWQILSEAGGASEQARAVGEGCLTASAILFVMNLSSRILRRGGIAEVHFRWPEAVTLAIRTKLAWLKPIVLATQPIVVAMTLSPDTPGGPAVARLAMLIWLVALATALYVLLRPHGPALAHFLKIRPGGWVDRLRWVWYPVAFLSPVALGAVALGGYVETCRELSGRFLDTIGLILGLILVTAVVTRWLTLARRRVAMEQSRRRQEALAAKQAAELGAEAPTGAAITAPEPETNLEDIDAQTRQLLRFGVGLSAVFGIWGIWVGVLPALGMLDRVQIWPRLAFVQDPQRDDLEWLRSLATPTTGSSAPAAGAATATPASAPDHAPPPAATATPAQQPAPTPSPMGPMPIPTPPPTGAEAEAAAGSIPFTLGDLLAALVLALVTLVAARNIPGVAEIVVLQRLPLDKGSRYALATVIRYAILIVGVSATLTAVGLSWDKVQWLAAALTFGLAFGLQEIFANFVSGLIILGERPIRIGDLVTVNNVSGTVTRIKMRATTIMDFDGKEMVVPNRSFITGAVINWTLSDPTLRIVIPVGVAYGSDVALVKETLLRVGRACPYALPGKEPAAWFLKFGESCLDFELRVWARTVDEAMLTRDELHRSIDKAFREAGIEISFPQRDLHLRTVAPEAAAVLGPRSPGAGGPPGQ